MICHNCIEAQAELNPIKYIRIDRDNADVMIVGCYKHLKRLEELSNVKYETDKEIERLASEEKDKFKEEKSKYYYPHA